MDNEKLNEAAEPNPEAPSRSTQLKRWVLTINNPFWDDKKDTEVDMTANTLPVLADYYDLESVKNESARGLFVFKHIKISVKDKETKEEKEAVILRPYFRNYESVKSYIENLEHFKYAVFQLEQGENETPHIQAGIIFEAGKRFYTMKKYFPTAHIESAKGTNAEVRAYCTKEDGRLAEPVEIGKFSEMRSRNDIEDFLELVKMGVSNATIKKLFPVLYTQFGPEKIERFRQDELKEEYGKTTRDITVTFIYGPARLGKTSYIYDMYSMEEVCRVNNYAKGTFEGSFACKSLSLLRMIYGNFFTSSIHSSQLIRNISAIRSRCLKSCSDE